MSSNKSISKKTWRNAKTIVAAGYTESQSSKTPGATPTTTAREEQEVDDGDADLAKSQSLLLGNAVAHHDSPNSQNESDASVETAPDECEFDWNADLSHLVHSSHEPVEQIEVGVEDRPAAASVGRTTVPPKRNMVNTNSCSFSRKDTVEEMVRRNVPPDPSWPTYSVRILKSSDDWEEIKKWERYYRKRPSQRPVAVGEERLVKQIRCRYPQAPSSWITSDSEEGSRSPVRSLSAAPLPPSRAPSLGTTGLQPSSSPLPGQSGVPGSPGAGAPPPPHFHSAVPPPCSPSLSSPPPCPGTDQDFRTQQTPVLQLLERVLANQALILKEIGILKRRSEFSEEREKHGGRGELPQGYSYPIHTQEELQDLDAALGDDAVREQFEQYICSLRGETFKVQVQHAGKVLMTPSLQGQYNLLGRNKSGLNKSAFKQLSNLHMALYNAASQNHQVDRKSYDTYLNEWLSQWKVRLQNEERPSGSATPEKDRMTIKAEPEGSH